MAILLQHVRVEEITAQRVIVPSENRQPLSPNAGFLIRSVLGSSIGSTNRRIVRTWEERLANAGTGVVVCITAVLTALLAGLPARWGGWRCGVCFLIAVGGGDHDFELVAVVACVGC